MATAEMQLELLHAFLADHPRPAGVSVSGFVQLCADSGDSTARQLLASGLFSDALASIAEREPAKAPIVSAQEQSRVSRIAGPHHRRREMPAAPRRIVQSSESRPWLK